MSTPPLVVPTPLALEQAKADLTEAIARNRRAALIVNTRSRKGQSTYTDVKRLLGAQGVTLDAAYPVRDPARLPEVVTRCVADGHDLVIVGGGDGSISAVAGAFANRKVVLGLLPLGTANSFARTLGIPLDLAGAVDAIVNGKVVDVDLGRINGLYFANAAAIGLQPAIARAVPHGLKKALGRIGYLVVAAGMLTRMRPFGCTIVTQDGTRHRFAEALEVRIANGGYKGGLLVAREADVESGDLVVHVVVGHSVGRLAKIWAQVVAGVPPPTDELIVLRSTAFTITTEPSSYVSIDGEAIARTPIEVSVARQALRIMAPLGQPLS